MNANEKKIRKKSPFYRLLCAAYRCFLLHFLLGLSVTCVLFLFSVSLDSLFAHPPVNAMFYSSFYQPEEKQEHTSLSCRLFETTLYFDTQGMTEPAFLQIASFSDTPSDYENASSLPMEDASSPLELPAEALLSEPETADETLPDTVRCVNLSGQTDNTAPVILYSNQTAYTPDTENLLSAPYPLAKWDTADTSGAPLVLILHTHGTESFLSESETARSEDTARNIVAVGDVLAETLTDAGIPVLHCRTMFDKDSYNQSYLLSADYIRETVAEYPSIQYVFDVHRDALETTDGYVLRPLTTIGATPCAQIMSVVGTDAAGAEHPHWETNLTVAVHLQSLLNGQYPDFARPINLRRATFNAQYAPGSILLEIGASGNTLSEAKNAARFLGAALATLLCQE